MQAQDIASLTFKRLRPTAYLSRFLDQNVREDARTFDEFRPTHINVGAIETADGSCMVKLGSTLVIAGVKAEIAKPDEDTPAQGWIIPNVDLSAGCSPRFKSGPPGDEVQALTDRILDIFADANPVPPESLLIERSKAAWCLYIDIVCLAYDGNACDAAILAAIGALRDVQLPEVWWDEEKGRTICSPRRQDFKRLQTVAAPLSFSFAIYDSKHLLADPSAFETALQSGSITLALSPTPTQPTGQVQRKKGSHLTISTQHASGRQRAYVTTSEKGTGQWLHSERLLDHCLRLAKKRYDFLSSLLDAEIQRSSHSRSDRRNTNDT